MLVRAVGFFAITNVPRRGTTLNSGTQQKDQTRLIVCDHQGLEMYVGHETAELCDLRVKCQRIFATITVCDSFRTLNELD